MEEPAPPLVAEEPVTSLPPVVAKPSPPAPRPVVKPEPKPEPPVAVADPRPAEPRTLKPGDAAMSEKAIRDRVASASRDLARIDYRRLSSPRRSQYDQSKRFVEQAEQAIREQNLVFAATLADKAAVLAAELAGR